MQQTPAPAAGGHANPSASHKLRVAVATPLSETLCAMIEAREPRLELIRDQALLPPMRHPADFAGDPSFQRSAEAQARFETLLADAEVLYGIPDLDPAALARVVVANPRLRWVHLMAAGGGGQVKAARLSREQLDRVAFTTSAGVHGGPLAEYALFGVLAGAKQLPRVQAQQRAHHWSGRWAMGQVSEQTVLLLGLGGIGREVARKLSLLGARVIGVSRHGRAVEHVDEIVAPEDLHAAAARADAVVCSLPGTAATEGLVDADFLAALPPGATFVNVGRGTVVDEPALIEALRAEHLGLAVLDVTASEPLAADSPLWDLPNVLLTPHTAALNAAEDRLIAELFVDNARRYLDGQPLRNRVDTVEFY
ncbi:D-2-hydroxyacid dehydrogenase [Salinicola sp. DM10]|uniref:D-2-hydroxyacid dehydrogenase n=1 Tax=Salinicola sp. DM10 TaxID=2815721 RepID=UPI001A8EE9B0|nr:D-2-hydroxyacid dehydrogenase [Salinicola sp. DM10]MCE3025645.1 D-2-hydroxyacid dehydrogenase [Salinicola sp. DM10]